MWRLWLEQGTSPIEVDREWTIEDVLDANEALDVAADVQHWRDRQRKAREDEARAREQVVRRHAGGR